MLAPITFSLLFVFKGLRILSYSKRTTGIVPSAVLCPMPPSAAMFMMDGASTQFPTSASLFQKLLPP